MSAEFPQSLSVFSDGLADAVAQASAAVLRVEARRRLPASGISLGQDLVLTADHVIEREDDIRLRLPDGKERPATLAGRDPGSDLAVLRSPGLGLAAADRALAESRVGQMVLALGRPASEGIQASLGVVSAVGGPLRTGRGSLLERYLRTDAVPYPGFSGGPLIDVSGRFLGMNTSGLWHGGSLTIPAAIAWSIAETLALHGRVKHGYLGIRSQPVALPPSQRLALGREQATGLLLVGVEEGSPAEQAGLLIGDILVGLGGQPVRDPDELAGRLVGGLVGQPAPVELLRAGQLVSRTVIIGERS